MSTSPRYGVALLFLLAFSGYSAADIGRVHLTTASSASGCIRIAPSAGSPSLASVGLTVSVTVLDDLGNPVPGYPFADLVLADDVGGADLSFCSGGWVADGNTDASGNTTISGVALGGGSTVGGLRLYQMGIPVAQPLPISVNSADLNGDLQVNMLDVANFAIAYRSPGYDFEVDLNCDGVIGLHDVTVLALALKPSCQ